MTTYGGAALRIQREAFDGPRGEGRSIEGRTVERLDAGVGEGLGFPRTAGRPKGEQRVYGPSGARFELHARRPELRFKAPHEPARPALPGCVHPVEGRAGSRAERALQMVGDCGAHGRVLVERSEREAIQRSRRGRGPLDEVQVSRHTYPREGAVPAGKGLPLEEPFEPGIAPEEPNGVKADPEQLGIFGQFQEVHRGPVSERRRLGEIVRTLNGPNGPIRPTTGRFPTGAESATLRLEVRPVPKSKLLSQLGARLLVPFFVGLPGLAAAHGINGHVHVTGWAIESLPPGPLRAFFDDAALRDTAQSGASFPDSGYAVDDAYGEMAHWEPFIEAYVRWIKTTHGPDFATDEARRHIAFMMGAASHGLQDEIVGRLVVGVDEAGIGPEGARHGNSHGIGYLCEIERAGDGLDRLGQQSEMARCARRGCGLRFAHVACGDGSTGLKSVRRSRGEGQLGRVLGKRQRALR